MRSELPVERHFSFVRRPSPVPADLRLAWRLPLVLLMLGTSRGGKSSLAKLHVLNDAVRSPVAMERLGVILSGKEMATTWRVRVEPALGRAVDFLVGEKLADWIEISQRAGLALNSAGAKAFNAILTADALGREKKFLTGIGKSVTEGFVSTLLSAKKGF